MRFILFFLVGMIAGMPCATAQPRICVDERQELSAIVWRLAGAKEYMQPVPPSYEADIRRAFEAFGDHPLMRFIRTMRDAPDSVAVVSYNSAPVAAAVLRIEKGHVRLASSLDVADYLKRVDPRWTADNLKRYVRLLDDFYRRSHFDRFFRDHRMLYDAYVEETRRLYDKTVHPDWFERFYGMPFPELSVFVSPAYGVHNYALSERVLGAMGLEGVGVLMGVAREPRERIGNAAEGVLIHEISHYFTNRIFPQYNEQLLPAGAQLFAALPRRLTAAGYGAPRIVCGEYLNELCSMIYCREMLGDDLSAAIRRCRNMGFIWAEEGLVFMDNFTSNRSLYPAFSDFMPQLAGFMRSIGENIETIKRIYNEPPYVVSTFPASGTAVPADIREVRIRFSHPMNTGLIAIRTFDDESILPLYDDSWYDDHEEDPEYWADDHTLVIRIPIPLQPGKRYGVILPALLCKENNVSMNQDYDLIFNTIP